jgi:hypothetical protein
MNEQHLRSNRLSGCVVGVLGTARSFRGTTTNLSVVSLIPLVRLDRVNHHKTNIHGVEALYIVF